MHLLYFCFPEVLDKEEFENPQEYDENTILTTDELGLLVSVMAGMY